MPEMIPAGPTVRNDKNQKPKRSTKFDFSGTNYETCTLGHMACLEAMFEDDPELIEKICKQAREFVGPGVRKPCDEGDNNKYATLKADPEFLARTLLFKKGKKSNRRDEVINGNDGHGNNSYYNNHSYNDIQYNVKGTPNLRLEEENNYDNSLKTHNSDEDIDSLSTLTSAESLASVPVPVDGNDPGSELENDSDADSDSNCDGDDSEPECNEQ